MREKEVVAAFDFDGTITYCDSLVPFLFYSTGFFKWLGNMAAVIPAFVKYVFKSYSRQDVKEAIVSQFFGGMPITQVRELGQTFAANGLHRLLKPAAMKRLHWHKRQGHRLILISASLDIYLEPWAKAEGFQDIITSSLQIDADGCVTGKLLGENCRGPEKTRRLAKLLGSRDAYVLYAYGDSRGDKELLEYADFPYYKTMPEET